MARVQIVSPCRKLLRKLAHDTSNKKNEKNEKNENEND